MKSIYSLVALVFLLGSCSKSDKGGGSTSSMHPYFKDNVMNENVKGSQTFQRALGYFPLNSDPSVQIMVASRGAVEHYDAKGFRIASISKANGNVNWIKSYDLDDKYFIQIATCAAMDQNENIWVGGHCFADGQLGHLFLVKLDKQGNMIWSKAFDNYNGWRAYSLEILNNGDAALLTKSVGGMTLHRVSSDGQPVWSVIAFCKGQLSIDDDYYNDPGGLLSPENHGLTETSDGSIFFAGSSNGPVGGIGVDHLVKLDGKGNLIFSKSYTIDGNSATLRPLQLMKFGSDKLLLANQAHLQTSASPYFSILSPDGTVSLSRGRPFTLDGISTLTINQVNVYQGNIYLSTFGGYEFDTYVMDASLNLKSSVKTAAAVDIGTDRGGISLFDQQDQALYYVLNFGGNYGESNGFEVTRNDVNGKPCVNTYTKAPSTLTLEDKHIVAATDTSFSFSYGPNPSFVTLPWITEPVAVKNALNVCGL